MPDLEPEANPRPSEKASKKGIPSYVKGLWWPAWALLLAPFIIVFGFLYRTVREEVNLKAALATVALFELVVFPHEWFSLRRGYWIYNEARILGPRIFGVVPIEEPLMYYVFPPLIVIIGMHVIRKILAKRGSP